MMEIADIERVIQEKDLRCVLVGTPDTSGIYRGRGIKPAHFVKTICEEGLGICDCIYIMDTLDKIHEPTRSMLWFPNWVDGMRDYVIKPDLSTFRIIPWLDRTAAVIGDVYDQFTGDLLETAPRSILKKMIDRADKLGYSMAAASELELIVFPESIAEIADKSFKDIKKFPIGVYDYSIHRLGIHNELVEQIYENRNLGGIIIDTYQSEAGPGQFEFNLRHCDVLEAADRAFLYKMGVRQIAARQGMTATFMAKLHADDFGNGYHVHQSLLDKQSGRNLFWDSTAEHNMSQVMAYYAGGLLSIMPGFTLLWAPYVNSYKRLALNSAAGINKTWGIDNRTVAIRVLAESEGSCRLEQRTPGADANPYLVMASMLAGGLYGIENKVEPPGLFKGNAYELTAEDCEQVPRTLPDAIKAFLASGEAREYFGEKFVEYYAEFRNSEYREFCSYVTDWEKKKYLEMA